MMNLHNEKLDRLLACPNCKRQALKLGEGCIQCETCGESYELFHDTPVLIKKDSPVLEWYRPKMDSKPTTNRLLAGLMSLYWRLRPEARVWTRRSQDALQARLDEAQPANPQTNVVLIGAGFESVYRRILGPYKDIIRMGLATQGQVDLFSDVCEIPLPADSLDLILSSSVLEHVYDPEQAVSEMYRVVKPGGCVYAEIPFMRAYHMIPVDYQRYTISGIEQLFKRHGFQLIGKGVCSGPFTASVLFFIDFIGGLFSFNRYAQAVIVLILSVLLHPIKYLDRLSETSKWAEVGACNFYYAGRKPAL